MYFKTSLSAVHTDFESRRWYDEQYSEIRFKGCSVDGAADRSTHVDLQRVRSMQPDTHNIKKYVNCFKGRDSVTKGEWHGLDKGKYYFRIDRINGEEYTPHLFLFVREVVVDSTQAD
ncbi:hypothetical protein AB0E11_06405 [Streptomyces fradiae]|uniref:hypothetical protein n=1 Tax=Streptomyces TaxID=1883 RepID=UPI002F416EDE